MCIHPIQSSPGSYSTVQRDKIKERREGVLVSVPCDSPLECYVWYVVHTVVERYRRGGVKRTRREVVKGKKGAKGGIVGC